MFSEQNSYQYKNENYNSLQKSARIGFIRKVYSIIAVQLGFTTLFCFLALKSRIFQKFQRTNDGLFITLVIINLVTFLVLSFSRKLATKVPINYILLGVFTFTQAYILSGICSLYSSDIVILAACLTFLATLGLSLYAITTKHDFSYLHGSLGIFFSVFSGIILLKLFLNVPIINLAYGFLGTIATGFYLIHDTQKIMGGRIKEEDIDNYISGAMNIYLDIIRIFLKILQILAKLQEKNQENDKKKK